MGAAFSRFLGVAFFNKQKTKNKQENRTNKNLAHHLHLLVQDVGLVFCV